MTEDWTFQHQHEQPTKLPIPKYKDGDKVIWEDEIVTIKGVGRVTGSKSITYDIAEHPHLFVWESEIEEYEVGA